MVVVGRVAPCASYPNSHVGLNAGLHVRGLWIRHDDVLGSGLAFDVEMSVNVGESGDGLPYDLHLCAGEGIVVLIHYCAGYGLGRWDDVGFGFG